MGRAAWRGADLLWDDVQCLFDSDLMGSLPDVRVPDASMQDWQAVLDLVAEKGWECRYSEGEAVLPVPRAEAVLFRPADAECPDLRVWPTADVLAIFRSHADGEVDFDVDLRELRGQERRDVFCGFFGCGWTVADGPGHLSSSGQRLTVVSRPIRASFSGLHTA
ncbi:hypothetical protein SDIAM103S_05371 [Streptomyces diastaticus subsp. diastaticus]|nr:hypothetical protein [Streptomyces sp. DSM 41037]